MPNIITAVAKNANMIAYSAQSGLFFPGFTIVPYMPLKFIQHVIELSLTLRIGRDMVLLLSQKEYLGKLLVYHVVERYPTLFLFSVGNVHVSVCGDQHVLDILSHALYSQ